MKIEELRKSIAKISALMDIYDEIRGTKGSGSNVELDVAKEQVISALVDAKKLLVEMERETKNA